MCMNVQQMHKQYANDLLTAREAAQILPSTSAATVSRWARDRLIPYVELPNGRRFFERQVIESLVTRIPARDDGILPGFGESGEC